MPTHQTPRSPRQTLSYLRSLLSSHGLRPKNKLGQSFLIDLNLLDVVLRAAELSKTDMVLEVGSGTGSLTSRLADEAGGVLGVEVDPGFFALARETVTGRDNVQLLYADILKNKNTLNRSVLEQLQEMPARLGCSQLKLVANLPYAIATPLIANLLLTDLTFERMVVMVQSEIADRLMAQPGTKEYGALAVLVQSLADVEAVRRQVPPSVFWPRPRVASAIVCIRPNPAKRAQVGDVAVFRDFLRSLYSHRRKNLRGALDAFPNGKRDKPQIDTLLAALGVEGTARAETLAVDQHIRLCRAFSAGC